MAVNAKPEKTYYCRGDQTHHYKSDLPKTLRPFVDYVFSSGGIAGDDFSSFNTKFKNAIKALLPDGYNIHKWNKMHYCCSAVIQTPTGNYIYISISDVRFGQNEWFSNILYRTMNHEKDYSGGQNRFTTLFTLARDIQRLNDNTTSTFGTRNNIMQAGGEKQ